MKARRLVHSKEPDNIGVVGVSGDAEPSCELGVGHIWDGNCLSGQDQASLLMSNPMNTTLTQPTQLFKVVVTQIIGYQPIVVGGNSRSRNCSCFF